MNKFKLLSIFVFVFSIFKIGVAQTVHPHYEDGNLYIKAKPEYSNLFSRNANVSASEFPFLDAFAKSYTITEIRHQYAFAKSPGIENILKISIADINKIDEAVAFLERLPELELAEKVPYKTFYAIPPNDTSYTNPLQWNLFKINAQVAWNYVGNPTPSQTKIAIIDDGLDINHIDLKANLWVNELERNGLPGVDDDGNFVVDDSLGYDFGDFDTDASPNDPSWHHGTHVSGIAGAVTNNITGVASIGYNARLMAVKGSSSNLFVSNGFEAVAYAADNGADVINLSWGAPTKSVVEENTILYAYLLGTVVVSASGNGNDAVVNYPAAYPHVISVANTANNDVKAISTTYGQWIDVSAPGVNIFSTIPSNSFATLSGTSMSSPLVAGLAGLMKTYNPLLTVDQIEACIINNVDNIDFMNPNYIGKLGSGRINAFKAMQCVNATKNGLDASLVGSPNINAYICDASIAPQITFRNNGISNLQSLQFNYKINNGPISSFNWMGNMGYDSVQTITLPTMSFYSGTNQLTVYCSSPNNMLDWNYYNDTLHLNFKVLNSGLSLPFTDNFENGLQANSWKINNPDGKRTWQIKSGVLDSVPNKAAFINMYNYDAIGQRDGLLTPPLNFSGFDSIRLQADYAWQRNFQQKSDSLIIFASTDCGASFSYRIAAFTHDSLSQFASTNDTSDVYFNPTTSSKWCGNSIACIDLDLTSLAGNSSVILKFETYNNFNNNLFLDNINISGSSQSTSIPTGNTIAISESAICQNEIVTFTASSASNDATSWNWTFPNGNPSSANTQSVTVQFTNTGSATAQVIIGNANGSAASVSTTAITINALPIVSILQNDTTICSGSSVTLNASGASSYMWSPSIGLNDSIGNTVISTPQGEIAYTVTGTNAAGCVNSASITIDTTACLSVANITTDNFTVLYSQNENTLWLNTTETSGKNYTVSIYNALGQVVSNAALQQVGKQNKVILNCASFQSGLYVYNVTNEKGKSKTGKFIVNKNN